MFSFQINKLPPLLLGLTGTGLTPMLLNLGNAHLDVLLEDSEWMGIFESSPFQGIHDSLIIWVVVSSIFYFHPYSGKWSNLTHIFQMGWNHQLEWLLLVYLPLPSGFFLIWWTQMVSMGIFQGGLMQDPCRLLKLIDDFSYSPEDRNPEPPCKKQICFFLQQPTRWWFQRFFILTPTWGNDPIWRIFFRMINK